MQQLTHSEVCTAFAKLAIEHGVPLFRSDSTEEAAKYLDGYSVSTGLKIDGDYIYCVDPGLFITSAYETLRISDFPWSATRHPDIEKLTSVTDLQTAMFLDAFNIYLTRCAIHRSIPLELINEPVNYFVKKDADGVFPLEGPFEKVASTFFGGKQLDYWDIKFPEDKDMIVAYNSEGILRMVMRYQGKSTSHY